jgi:cytochrome c peroxidase
LKRLVLLTLALSWTALAQDAGAPKGAGTTTPPTLDLLASFSSLPAQFDSQLNPASESKVALGRMLFYDKRLSKNHDVSCNSCHDLAKFGVDGRRFSTGHKKQLGGRNSPTVYNAGGHIAQFWDGRAETLEDQAKGPVTNPVEMAMPNPERVVETLKSIPQYVELFQKAFPNEKDPVTFDNAAKAIGVFERGLVTPSRFDKFVKGDTKALTAKEKDGLKTFVETGCTTCHNGAAVGGSSFQRLGLVEPYPDQEDLGRFGITQDEADKMKFRVPSLRNVEKTGPYFHTGKLTKLDEVVKTMARHQLGKNLTNQEVGSIVAFLKSLTGEIPTAYIKAPALPPSTATTPKPDPS